MLIWISTCIFGVLALGYDSINFFAITAHVPELIICSGDCATVRSFSDACPPLELKRQPIIINNNPPPAQYLNDSTLLYQCKCNSTALTRDLHKINYDVNIKVSIIVINIKKVVTDASSINNNSIEVTIGFSMNILQNKEGSKIYHTIISDIIQF